MASVREAPFVAPTHAEQLRELEWLISAWADAEENRPSGVERNTPIGAISTVGNQSQIVRALSTLSLSCATSSASSFVASAIGHLRIIERDFYLFCLSWNW